MPAGNPPNVYFIMTLRSASSSLIHQVLPKVRTPEHKCLGASQYAAHLQAVPIIFFDDRGCSHKRKPEALSRNLGRFCRLGVIR